MSKVLVTGGIGSVGCATVAHLLNLGYTVRIFDRASEADARSAKRASMYADAEYVQGDLNHYEAVLNAMTGCDQVIHLAALAAPMVGTPEEVFHVNATGTFNVFQAADTLGIKRISQASSINAIGMFYGVKPVEPDAFPIDEDQAPHGTDAYSFSKWVIEEIAAFFWQRSGISSVSLRFPGVQRVEFRQRVGRRTDLTHQLVERLEAMSEADRLDWWQSWMAELTDLRARRMMESGEFMHALFSETPVLPPEKMILLLSRDNFWALIDERDAAQALEKGLSAAYVGAHPLFVNDAVNSANIPSETLLRLFFPNVVGRKKPLEGTESLVSIQRARDLIGFEPKFSFHAE